mmetsp:Transcript_25244/g.64181  ORF Transcript_25244/g.64181 Transcript_25244/m.64181 type:complete len:248 (-) Transcript_25244:537-1280(-)
MAGPRPSGRADYRGTLDSCVITLLLSRDEFNFSGDWLSVVEALEELCGPCLDTTADMQSSGTAMYPVSVFTRADFDDPRDPGKNFSGSLPAALPAPSLSLPLYELPLDTGTPTVLEMPLAPASGSLAVPSSWRPCRRRRDSRRFAALSIRSEGIPSSGIASGDSVPLIVFPQDSPGDIMSSSPCLTEVESLAPAPKRITEDLGESRSSSRSLLKPGWPCHFLLPNASSWLSGCCARPPRRSSMRSCE